MYFDKVAILGVGLIGASVGLALKKYGCAGKIMGYGRTKENLARAREKSIIDSFYLNPAEACDQADLIVFATPVGVFTEIAGEIAPVLKEGTLVTDVGSVKGNLVRDMERLLSPRGSFIGAHPIAGSDRSGIDSASAALFDKALCIVTPTPTTDKTALDKVISLWRSFGSMVTLIDPLEHDKIYGAVSHLPHLLAYELMNTVAEIDKSYLFFSGQGFKDTTRIAGSQPELWRDICIFNRDNIRAYVEIFKNNLDRVSLYLKNDDGEALLRNFRDAQALRERIGQG